MISNIEPIAREITRGICRDSEMPVTQIEQWVDLHWQCAAAMLEQALWMKRANGSKEKTCAVDWKRTERDFWLRERRKLQRLVTTLLNAVLK